MNVLRSVAILGCLFVAGCSNQPELDPLRSRTITLPSGKQVLAEVLVNYQDMERGMMFREQLPSGRGLLFVHGQPGKYSYWMFQVKVPLDIIWISPDRRIVEIAANVPGCPGPKESCPSYGGKAEARWVLELAGGEAAKLGLKVGDALEL